MYRFCIIIGAMKAGTTSLFNYLSCHDQIEPCSVKEPSFFCKTSFPLTAYLRLWNTNSYEDKYLIEASTNYSKYPNNDCAAENIKRFSDDNPVEFKFIYSVRNPLERIESHYNYIRARWTDKCLDSKLSENSHLVQISRYASQLDEYVKRFGRDQIEIVLFEDMKDNKEKVLRRLFNFLGVKKDIAIDKDDIIYNQSQGQLITRSVHKWYFRYPWLKKTASIIPGHIRKSMAKLIFTKRIDEYVKLDDSQRKMIIKWLKEDILRLQDNYGVDISKWNMDF